MLLPLLNSLVSRVHLCENACVCLYWELICLQSLISPWVSYCMGGNQKFDIMALGSAFCVLNWSTFYLHGI